MNLNCFSQTNTNNQSQTLVSDTTRVKLKPFTARLVIKDIVRGEGCAEELKLTQEKVIKLEERETQKDTIISLLESKVTLKDSIISGHVQKGIMYEERIKNEQLKFDAQGLWVKDLQKQNKKLKVKLTFTKIVGAAVAGTLTYLYITK